MADWAVHLEHNKERPGSWLGKESKAVKKNGSMLRVWCGPKLLARAGLGTVAASEAPVVR